MACRRLGGEESLRRKAAVSQVIILKIKLNIGGFSGKGIEELFAF